MWPEIRIIDNGTPSDYSVAEAKAQGVNKWKGWLCRVGIDSLYIDFDGVVHRGPCRVGRPLGHILTGFELANEEIACTRDTCDCGSSIKLRKRKNADVFMIPLGSEPFVVQWDLGRRCNFDCSYCWPSSHDKTSRWWDVEHVKRTITHIHDRVRRQIQFNFAGGEPTLHPQIVDICTFIKSLDTNYHIHIQTNGSMSLRRARLLARVAELSISVHFEQANIDKLCTNIAAIISERGKLEVKMMVTPETTHRAHELKERLAAIPGIRHARVIISPLRDPDTNDLMSYTKEQIAEFGDVTF